MGKRRRRKDKRGGKDPAPPDLEAEPLSARGKKTIAAGIAVLILGFFVLSLTDPEGKNWASTLSPFLILGAYGIIAFGIFLPDPEPEPEPSPEAPEKTISS